MVDFRPPAAGICHSSSILNMSVVRWFVQFSWIGFCSVAMLWQTWLLQDIPQPSGWLTGFVFGSTIFGYNFIASKARRYAAYFIGLLSAVCFLELDLARQLTVVLPGLVWILYYDRYHPGQGTGLRDYPMLKPVAIALAWAWVTVWLPTPPAQWTAVFVLSVGQAAFIFVLALAYDLCDQPYDLRHGLTTLVMQLGPRNSIRLADAALVLATAAGWYYGLIGRYSWVTVLLLTLSYWLTAFAIRRIPRQTDWEDWRKAAIDGLMALQFILIWLSIS
ncbi:MAG: hypothetical protein EP344_15570 [Bacteroidetes bacterium]|nr:MAG: hypothetical protein EP344_15570 [Bacteroidota bacterium]